MADSSIRWDLVAAQAEVDSFDPWEDRPAALRPASARLTGEELTPKEQLLAHYATRPVTEYRQFDLAHQPGGDGLAVDDENGDIAFSTTSRELWHGFPVRIHVRRGTSNREAARLLRKALAWIDAQDPEWDGTGTGDREPWPTAPGGRGCSYHDPATRPDPGYRVERV